MNKLPTSKQRHKSNVCSRGRSRGCSSTFVKTCVSSQSTLIYIAKSRVNRYTVKTVNAPSFFFFFFVHFLGSFLMYVSFQCCINKLK